MEADELAERIADKVIEKLIVIAESDRDICKECPLKLAINKDGL